MRSSKGAYFVGLDHIRALAAFMVFTWHFNHVNNGQLSGPVSFPLSIFAEGHVGVGLFMALSGYLFAKLLDGQRIIYIAFLWNRVLRIFPLLIVVFIIYFLQNLTVNDLGAYFSLLLNGLIRPFWPNGGWSIAVELHFYIILPLLLAFSARNAKLILIAILISIGIRWVLWSVGGSVQSYAYWTFIGGIDHFVMGIFAFKTRLWITGRHFMAALIALLVLGYIRYFDTIGGFYSTQSYPSRSGIWIIHPTLVGIGFAYLIAWYDTSFQLKNKGLSGFLASIGASSYSIYLLHFFVVFRMAHWIDDAIISLTSFPIVLLFSVLSFLCILPITYLSYRFIELPPLQFRHSYRRT